MFCLLLAVSGSQHPRETHYFDGCYALRSGLFHNVSAYDGSRPTTDQQETAIELQLVYAQRLTDHNVVISNTPDRHNSLPVN